MLRRRDSGGSALDSAIERLSALPPASLMLTAVVLVALVGIFDWASGPDVSVNVGYMIPVFLAAAHGRRPSLGVAWLATVVWSVIEFMSRERPYSSPIIPYWNVCARFAVLALVAVLVSTLTSRLAKERGLSRTDQLTGLPNARAFHEATAIEIDRMRHTGGLLTAVYVDVDDFKAVNDTLGHAAGDELLALTANTMRASLRTEDVVARMGGDEFAVLLPGASLADATARLARVHADLITATAGVRPPIGFSIGAVAWTEPPASGEQLLARADRVMYGVKQHGKNTVWAEPASSADSTAPTDPAELSEPASITPSGTAALPN